MVDFFQSLNDSLTGFIEHFTLVLPFYFFVSIVIFSIFFLYQFISYKIGKKRYLDSVTKINKNDNQTERKDK